MKYNKTIAECIKNNNFIKILLNIIVQNVNIKLI